MSSGPQTLALAKIAPGNPAPKFPRDFPREMAPIPAGKPVHFSTSAPHTSTGAENGHATACKRSHTTPRLTETLPGPACFQPQNYVLIQTLSCPSGMPWSLQTPDPMPSAT